MIRLEKIDNKNIWKACEYLHVSKEQEDFVATNYQSIAEAYLAVKNGFFALPLAIYNDETLVGFCMIGKGTINVDVEPDFVKEYYSIWRLMIDEKYQHKGYGKKALEEMIKIIKTYPSGKANKVWLSYEEENVIGKNMYLSLGFKETEERVCGEIVAMLDL